MGWSQIVIQSVGRPSDSLSTHYLRTVEQSAAALWADDLECKFNPNHDEQGRFTFGDGGGRLKPVRGYPDTGKDAWRAANDAVFIRAAADWNAKNGLKPGDPRYLDPQFMKAWAMVESGGDKRAFLTDPFQVNKPGDWDLKLKPKIGLNLGQAVTPVTSASAALSWLDLKAHETIGSATLYIGRERALQHYNGNNRPDRNGQPHKIGYAKHVLSLAGGR